MTSRDVSLANQRQTLGRGKGDFSIGFGRQNRGEAQFTKTTLLVCAPRVRIVTFPKNGGQKSFVKFKLQESFTATLSPV